MAWMSHSGRGESSVPEGWLMEHQGVDVNVGEAVAEADEVVGHERGAAPPAERDGHAALDPRAALRGAIDEGRDGDTERARGPRGDARDAHGARGARHDPREQPRTSLQENERAKRERDRHRLICTLTSEKPS